MKKTIVITLLIISFFGVESFGQQYKTGLGIRLGTFSGITVKHFIKPQNALEGLLSFRWNGFVITGLYEWQKPIKEVNNLDWYIGCGAHIGFWDGSNYYYHGNNNAGHTVVGIDGIIGLEYSFDGAPFSIGLDWKPAINLVGDTHWWGDGIGLSFRYDFK